MGRPRLNRLLTRTPGTTTLSLTANPDDPALTWVGFRTGPAAGYLNVGSNAARAISLVSWGQQALVQVVGWYGKYNSYAEALDAFAPVGFSAPLTVTLPAGPTDPNLAKLVGLQSFAIGIPEPSTFALAGFGAAALWVLGAEKLAVAGICVRRSALGAASCCPAALGAAAGHGSTGKSLHAPPRSAWGAATLAPWLERAPGGKTKAAVRAALQGLRHFQRPCGSRSAWSATPSVAFVFRLLVPSHCTTRPPNHSKLSPKQGQRATSN